MKKEPAKLTPFVLNRDKTYASTKGHVIEFEKDVPIHVPPALHAEVAAIGAVRADGVEVDMDETRGGTKAPQDPDARKEAVFEAFELIILNNDSKDFTAGNAPHTKAVNKLLGWDITGNERDVLWAAYQKSKNEE